MLDTGPRPYTVTDMVAGLIAVALLEIMLGGAISNSFSAGWGVFVGMGTFLIIVSLVGLRLRSGIASWLGARRLARTNIELVTLGDDSIEPDELCTSVLCLRRCTSDDATPLRRIDIDEAQGLSSHELPRVWVLAEGGRVPTRGEVWPAAHDEQGRRLTPCTVVRESLGRSSSTFAVLRSAVVILLVTLMVVVVMASRANPVGCTMAAVLFFVIAGLIPMRRIAFADRMLASSQDGLWLVLDEGTKKRRDAAIAKRAKELGIAPDEVPADDRVMRTLPRAEIRIPWRECYTVLYRPRATTGERAMKPGTAWRWRIYPPRGYWDALGVGGTYAIGADGVEPTETPWVGVEALLADQ